MSRTRPLRSTSPTDVLRIVRWDDPALDAIGHDPRSAYVERFWLPLLGPSTTFLIRRITAALEASPRRVRPPPGGHRPVDRAGPQGRPVRALPTGPSPGPGSSTSPRRRGPPSWRPAPGSRPSPATRSSACAPPCRRSTPSGPPRQHAAPDLEQQRTPGPAPGPQPAGAGRDRRGGRAPAPPLEDPPGLAHEALRWAEARQPVRRTRRHRSRPRPVRRRAPDRCRSSGDAAAPAPAAGSSVLSAAPRPVGGRLQAMRELELRPAGEERGQGADAEAGAALGRSRPRPTRCRPDRRCRGGPTACRRRTPAGRWPAVSAPP